MSEKKGAVFKSIKSLPVDYRFMDSTEKSASSNSSMRSDSMRKNGGTVHGNHNIDQVDDDSPYGNNSPIVLMDDEDVTPSFSNKNSILPSRGWDDISVYNAKKVKLFTYILS